MIGANGGPVPDAGYLLRCRPNVPERGLFAVAISPPHPRQTLPPGPPGSCKSGVQTPNCLPVLCPRTSWIASPAQKAVPAVDVAVRGCRFL
jgi:hypothetical protein